MSSIINSLKGLLGGGSSARNAQPAGETVEHEGYLITPKPKQEGGQWLTAGTIAKESDGERQEHHFIRADRHASRNDAEAFSVTKAKQIIGEQGDRIFVQD